MKRPSSTFCWLVAKKTTKAFLRWRLSALQVISLMKHTKGPELELESLKVNFGEKGRKAEKGRKGGFGYAISLLANMPKCHKMP